MTESLKAKQTIEGFTENLTLEVFIDVMTTANVVNSNYKKLFPDSSNDQTYEQMWKNIKALRNRQDK